MLLKRAYNSGEGQTRHARCSAKVRIRVAEHIVVAPQPVRREERDIRDIAHAVMRIARRQESDWC